MSVLPREAALLVAFLLSCGVLAASRSGFLRQALLATALTPLLTAATTLTLLALGLLASLPTVLLSVLLLAGLALMALELASLWIALLGLRGVLATTGTALLLATTLASLSPVSSLLAHLLVAALLVLLATTALLAAGLELSGRTTWTLLGLLTLLLAEFLGVPSIGSALVGPAALLAWPSRLLTCRLLFGWNVPLLAHLLAAALLVLLSGLLT